MSLNTGRHFSGKDIFFFSIVFFVITFILSGSVFATCGPRYTLTEWTSAYYDTDGSVLSDSAWGEIRVSVPNNDDVLQNVNLTLSGYGDTTITSDYATRNVVWSDPANDTDVLIYTTTSDDGANDNQYTITNMNTAPRINLSLSYENQQGGYDIYSTDNVGHPYNNISFTLTISNPSSTTAINNAVVNMTFDEDVNGAHDSVAIQNDVSASSGTATRYDLDGDGEYDRISWSGNLAASASVTVFFSTNMTQGIHFTGTSSNLDAGSIPADHGVKSYYSNNDIFTSLAVTDKFARASIRQGVDMSYVNGEWLIRGFIRNMATENPGAGECYLTYYIDKWDIYEINPSTGEPYPNANQTGNFSNGGDVITPSDGRIYTNNGSWSNVTDWFHSGYGTKPYYTVSFDWQVVWESDNTVYTKTSYINTSLNLPTLYLIDVTPEKTHAGGYLSPDTGGESVTINDTVTFAGNDNAEASSIEIFSWVPVNTTAGNFHGNFTINESSIAVWFLNGTATRLNISGPVTLTVQQPSTDGSYDGYINLSISDLSSAYIYGTSTTIGDGLDGTEAIRITYSVISSPQMTTGDSYNFTGNTSLVSITGTPLTEDFTPLTISVSGKRLSGYKDLFIPDINNPTLVNSTIVVTTQTSTGLITGVKFVDYVPNGTGVTLATYKTNITVRFYDGSWHDWTVDTDFQVIDRGFVQLSDGHWVHAFEIDNTTGNGFNMGDNYSIETKYQLDINQEGVWTLPVEIAGFDPNTGTSIKSIAYGVVKIQIPENMVPLQITEGNLSLAKRVVVGKPALWIKQFDVYNPNSRRMTTRFKAEIFDDATDGYVSYIDDKGDKIEQSVNFIQENGKRYLYWDDSVGPLESRSYELRVLTPPVLEVDRDVEVLDKLENKRVKLKLDIFLKSFAQEDYENVVLNLPIPYDNVIEVKDSFGNNMKFTGGKKSLSITVDKIRANDMKTVTVIYTESYPTIIITPDRDRYNLNSPVKLDVLIINGGEKIEHPYVELEVYTPDMQLIYTTIKKLDGLKPLEKTELYEKFVIPPIAPGGNYMATARFRQDFATLASSTGNFYVAGVSGLGAGPLSGIAVLVAALILGYFSFRRLKEVRKNRYY